MATDWSKRVEEIRTKGTNSTTNWDEKVKQILVNNKVNNFANKYNTFLNNAQTFATDYDNFYSKWHNEDESKIFLDKSTNFYNSASDLQKDLKTNAEAYKSMWGDKKYNDLYDFLSDTAKSGLSAPVSYANRTQLYGKYENEKAYNEAKTMARYAKKYSDIKNYKEYKSDTRTADYVLETLPEEERNYLEQKGFILEYTELLSAISSREQRLETMKNKSPKSNSSQRITLGTEEKKLTDELKALNKKKAELDKKGGVYSGLINQILSNSGEYYFDQKWAGAYQDFQDYIKESENKRKLDELSGKADYYTPNPDEMTEQEKLDALSGKTVQRKREDPYSLEIDPIFDKSRFNSPKEYSSDEDTYVSGLLEYYATEDEKKMHAFLKKTEGETVARQYLEELKVAKLDKRMNQAIFDEEYEYASRNPGTALASSISSVGHSLFSGIEFAANTFGAMNNPYYNNYRSVHATKANAQRSGVRSQIDSEIFGFLYDTGMSLVDSTAGAALSAVAPYLGEFLLGSSAAASSYNVALDRGVTGGDAVLTAVTSGLAESVFEHLSIGRILDAGDITKGFTKEGLKQAVKKIAADSFINFSEEALTELSNFVTDQLINGELSNYSNLVREYQSKGLSLEAAKDKAQEEVAKQIGLAGLSGLLMGFGTGTTNSFRGLANSQIANSRYGSIIKYNGEVQTLKNLAMGSGVAEIETAAKKITQTSNSSKIGYVYTSLLEKKIDYSVEKITNELIKKGAKKYGTNSAKGLANRIVRNALTDYNILDDSFLRSNEMTKDIYSSFINEGKYGGAQIFSLRDIADTTNKANKYGPGYVTKEGNIINDEGFETPMTADGQAAQGPVMGGSINSQHPRNIGSYDKDGEALPSTRGTLKAIATASRSGQITTIADAYGRSVAEKLDKERPAPNKAKNNSSEYLADTIQITPEEEQILKSFCKANGLNVEFTDGLVNDKGYGYYADGTIAISRYAKKPIRALFKHEFCHSVESAKGYAKFQKYVLEESKAFKEWLELKGFDDWKQAVRNMMGRYKANSVDYNKSGDSDSDFDKQDNNYEKAKADVVADFVADSLFGDNVDKDGNPIKVDTNFLVELKQKDRNMFQRFVEWVHSILKRMVNLDAVDRDIIKLEQKFKRLTEQARKERAKTEGGKTKSDGQYALAGENAITADKSLLAKAKDMLYNENVSREVVWKETGWKLGKDDKWRFEIDDSKMEFNRNGFFTNPDILRRNELFNKIYVNGNYTQEELQEYALLNKNLRGVKTKPIVLSDFIKHDALFEAYPELKHIKVELKTNLDDAANGIYNFTKNTIELDKARSDEAIKKTLIHEIQHAVQIIEGLAEGGNKKLAKMLGLLGAYSEVKNTAEYKRLTTPEARLEFVQKHLGTKFKGNLESDAMFKIYENLYGEIEARQSSERIDMNEDDRRNTFPENDGIVVFHQKESRNFNNMLREMGFDNTEVYKLEREIFYGQETEINQFTSDGRRKVFGSYEGDRGIRESSGGRKEENRRNANRITKTQADSINEPAYSLPEFDSSDDFDYWMENEALDDIENVDDFKSIKKEKSVDELKRDVKRLKTLLNLSKKETHGTEFHPDKIEKAARRLIRNADSTYNVSELTDELTDLYRYIAKGEEVSFEEINDKARKIAQNLYDNMRSQKPDTSSDFYELKKFIQNNEFSLNDKQKEEIVYVYGSMKNFLNKNMGKLKYRANAVPLDVLWNGEWHEQYPGVFGLDENDVDLPLTLAELYKDTELAIEVETKVNEEDFINQFSAFIYDEFWNVPNITTVADKYSRQLAILKSTQAKRISTLREQRDAKVEKTKKYYQNMVARIHETHNSSAVVKKIRKQLSKFATLLSNPNQNKHIPSNLVKPIKALCDAFNYSTKGEQRIYEKLSRVEDAYSNLESDTNTELDIFDENVLAKIREAKSLIGDKRLSELSHNDLVKVYDIIRMFAKNVSEGNKLFKAGRSQTVAEKAKKAIDIMNKKGFANVGKVKSFLQTAGYSNMKPEIFFRTLDNEVLLDLYYQLRDSEDVWASDMLEAHQKFEAISEKYKKDLKDNGKPKKFETQDGEVELTTEQIMFLYAAYKRPQYKKHILEGGFVFDKDVKVKKKDGKTKVEAPKTPFRLSPEQLSEIVGTLKEGQRKFVDELQMYLSSDLAKKGNEVSRALYDFEIFKEKVYWPIVTSDNYLKYNPQTTADVPKIKNSGMTKETTPNANAPIVLGDFLNTWGKHVNSMALYHSVVLPIEDFYRVLGYKEKGVVDGKAPVSLRTAIENTYGTKAMQTITTFLRDVNGGIKADNEVAGNSKLLTNFKKSAVTLNLSVAVQQRSSIVRAMSMINPKYFVKSRFSKRDYAEMMKYAPVSVIKEMGYFDSSVSTSANDWLLNKNKWDEFLGALPKAIDRFTWMDIWNATKKEVAAKGKYRVGSEEYLNACGKRFTEVITRTQVYDSVFARTENRRKKSLSAQMLTAFTDEPMLAANMLFDSLKNGDFKTIASTIPTLLGAALFNSLLKSLVSATRDDDEEKMWWEKYRDKIMPNFLDNINPLGGVPIAKEVFSMLQGYDVKRTDFTAIDKIITNTKKLIDVIADDEKNLDYETVIGLIQSVADSFGIPMSNVVRDTTSLFRLTQESKPIVNVWGRDKREQYSPSKEEKTLESIIAELYANTKKSSVIPKKAEKIFDVNGEKIELTETEYINFRKILGEYRFNYAVDFTKHPMYKNLTDEQKAEGLSFLYSFANAKAKSDVSDYDYTSVSTYKSAAKFEMAGIDVTSYAIAKAAMRKDNADTDGSGSVDKDERKEALEKAGFSRRERNKFLDIYYSNYEDILDDYGE